MTQDEAETSKHLLEKGFIATDESGALVGTFSVDDGRITSTPTGEIVLAEGNTSVTFRSPKTENVTNGNYLVFKKLAVCPTVGKAGIGLQLYRTAEDMARARNLVGVALETVAEATWLYRWYIKLGFKAVGSFRYPQSPVDTVLMLKPFL